MAFDFPASPSTGQVFTPAGGPAYQYDGEKWKGGQVSGPQTEQFFDLSGKTSLAVTIPTWAKSARITLTTLCSVAYQNYMRWSIDGTTFISSTDYITAGFYHGANATFNTQGAVTLANLPLTIQNGAPTVPDIVDIILTTQTPAGNQFNMLTRSWAYGTTLLSTHVFYHHYSNLTALINATSLKAFLVFNDGTAWGAGSQMKVEWIGDAASVPISNAIADCPSDGGEYVRVNGVWRLKSQSFDFTGKATQDVVVPPSAKMASITASIQPTATAGGLYAQFSGDGTTFLTSSNYFSNGPYHTVSPAQYLTQSGRTGTGWELSGGHDNSTVPIIATVEMSLQRASDANFTYRSHSASYHSTTAYFTAWYSGYVASSVVPGILAIKALRFYGVTGKAGSVLSVEWIY